jgi:hypothetical protein
MSEDTPKFDLRIQVYLVPQGAWLSNSPNAEIKLISTLDVLQAQAFTVGGIVQAACLHIVVNQIAALRCGRPGRRRMTPIIVGLLVFIVGAFCAWKAFRRAA